MDQDAQVLNPSRDRQVSRREFLRRGALLSGALAAPSLLRGVETGRPDNLVRGAPPLLWGNPRLETDLEASFASLRRWGVRHWMSYGLMFHSQYGKPNKAWSNGVPFLADAWPGFRPHLDLAALAVQEEAARKTAALCTQNGIDYWHLLPFPLFPTTDPAVLRAVAPEFLRGPGAHVDLRHPRLPELLKNEIRCIKRGVPSLRGATLLLAEGAGTMGDLTAEDLEHNKEWERPLIAAFAEVTRELGLAGMVSAHHFLQTVKTHRNVFEVMGEFPDLIQMDDTSWPEEDLLHPFLGFLPEADRRLMLRNNPTGLKVLLDTEYLGQGVLPGVYPRWWSYQARGIARAGARFAIGRTFFWDAALTDVNFNRLNCNAFVQFCLDPEADPRQVLGRAAREMFGERIADPLIDRLWETEPMIKKVFGINGVACLDHSRFPRPECLDRRYGPHAAMKALDDLFEPPGTKLYPPLSDDLNNLKQWRWQNQTVAQPAERYLAEKRQAAAWTRKVLPEIRELAGPLPPAHRRMFVEGYAMLASLAGGMELVVEAAADHYAWAHAGILTGAAARGRFADLAARFRSAAAAAPPNPFEYREGMLAFAAFLERLAP